MLAFLLALIPGTGPFAPLIALIATALVKAEAKECLPIVRKLVAQAEANTTLTTGAEKFQWVLPRALRACLEAQLNVPFDVIVWAIQNEANDLPSVRA